MTCILILFLKYKYGKDVIYYFSDETIEDVKEENWNTKTQRVICTTNSFTEEDIVDNISLEEAQVCAYQFHYFSVFNCT